VRLPCAQNEGGEGRGVNSRVSAVPETERSEVEGVAETETGIWDAEVIPLGKVSLAGEPLQVTATRPEGAPHPSEHSATNNAQEK
jgi:hypothetical protein